MKKKDKKKNPQQVKAEQAQRKNLFWMKMKNVMYQVGCEEAYNMLPPDQKEVLYLARLRPITLECSPECGDRIKPQNLKRLNENLSVFLKGSIYTQVEDDGTERKISSYDLFKYLETLVIYKNSVDESIYPDAKKFKDLLSYLEGKEVIALRNNAREKLEDTITKIGWYNSDVLTGVLFIRRKFIPQDAPAKQFLNDYNTYVIENIKPEPTPFEIDGIKRNIYPVNVATKHVFGATITPEQLGFKGILQKMPLDVYYQSHLIERLKERIGLFHEFSYMAILHSLVATNIIHTEDGGFLLPFEIYKRRVGYLKATLHGDKLIIRTFLFITNNGTPEGKKLTSLIHVQKEDKKFLAIDKLQTFMESDLDTNEKIRSLFKEAGCGDLFKLKKEVEISELFKMKKTADYVSNYLGLNDESALKTPENELTEIIKMMHFEPQEMEIAETVMS